MNVEEDLATFSEFKINGFENFPLNRENKGREHLNENASHAIITRKERFLQLAVEGIITRWRTRS